MRIAILLPFPLSLQLFVVTLSLKLQQSGKIGGKLAIYLGKCQFYMHTAVCMYLLVNFVYSRLNCSRGNRFCIHDLCVTWIFQAGVSLLFFPQYKSPQMRVLYRAMYKIFLWNLGYICT